MWEAEIFPILFCIHDAEEIFTQHRWMREHGPRLKMRFPRTGKLLDSLGELSTGLDRRYLQPEDDIVQINWPDGWYIPTAKDLQLLVENTSVKDETINGNTWFRLTSSSNGNSILIPGTGYIDDSDNVEKWATEAYLQSSTIGVYTSKPTIHALRVAKSGASLANSAGRPTGLMVRPVKYVRVD